jgi:hypothetical protein
MALNTLPNAGLTNRGYPSDRLVTPIIINGDMSVAQRGTSFSFSSSSGFTVDRFDFERTSGATGDCTITQESDAPSNTGLVKSVKIAVDTAETPTGGGNCLFQQKLEGFNVAPLEHGQSNPPSATLSFWVKSNKTGTYSVQIKAEGSTGRYVLFDYTISSANTWEKKIITWVGDTSVALDYDSSRRLRVIWHLASGPDDKVSPTSSWATSSIFQMSSNAVNFFDDASNEIYFTGVQLEVGEFDSTSIPSFPFESYENNLQKCFRYCQKNPQKDTSGNYGIIAQGMADGSTLALCNINPLPVEMRTTASLSSSGSFRAHKPGGASSVSSIAINSDHVSSSTFAIRVTTSGITAGNGIFLEQNNDADAHIILDAEL